MDQAPKQLVFTWNSIRAARARLDNRLHTTQAPRQQRGNKRPDDTRSELTATVPVLARCSTPTARSRFISALIGDAQERPDSIAAPFAHSNPSEKALPRLPHLEKASTSPESRKIIIRHLLLGASIQDEPHTVTASPVPPEIAALYDFDEQEQQRIAQRKALARERLEKNLSKPPQQSVGIPIDYLYHQATAVAKSTLTAHI
jgi:hypothetical protein